MSFLVKECPKTYVVGFSTLVSIPQDPNDFSEMSAHKLEQLANLRQIKEDLESQAIDRHFYAVNDATASPHYLVGVKSNRVIPDLNTFEFPEGTYAVFSKTVADRTEADTFIASSYSELYQSSEFQVSGHYLLEVVDCFILEPTDAFSIYIPVTMKSVDPSAHL